MASFPSGVVILTAFGDDHQPRGLTVSAFCAVSVDPPLALVCIDKTSNTLPAVQHTGGFTANILAAGREHLARRMATKLSDKFDGIAWHEAEKLSWEQIALRLMREKHLTKDGLIWQPWRCRMGYLSVRQPEEYERQLALKRQRQAKR